MYPPHPKTTKFGYQIVYLGINAKQLHHNPVAQKTSMGSLVAGGGEGGEEEEGGGKEDRQL